MHGGATPIKHGLRSQYGPPRTVSRRIAAYENNPELMSHVRLAATAQALLDALMGKVVGSPTAEQVAAMVPLLSELRKTVTDWRRLADDSRFVDLLTARSMFGQMLERVVHFVAPERREEALDEVQAILGAYDQRTGGRDAPATFVELAKMATERQPVPAEAARQLAEALERTGSLRSAHGPRPNGPRRLHAHDPRPPTPLDRVPTVPRDDRCQRAP
jgi:hypothetical protein